MVLPESTLVLTDYDARLQKLTHQLDFERREMVLKFAHDLFLMLYHSKLESRCREIFKRRLH
jgi:hypothetical protein